MSIVNDIWQIMATMSTLPEFSFLKKQAQTIDGEHPKHVNPTMLIIGYCRKIFLPALPLPRLPHLTNPVRVHLH